MMEVEPNSGARVRLLRAEELERAVHIDTANAGRSRRAFLARRLRAAQQSPEDYLHLAVDAHDRLAGFALARVLRGEFGRDEAVAVLDVIDVDRTLAVRGSGQRLFAALGARLRERGVRQVYSESEWTNHTLLRFFAASGFQLARRVILERAVGEPLAEPAEAVAAGEAGAASPAGEGGVPQRPGTPPEIDYSTPVDDFGPLARDRIPTRSMNERDLQALAAIDQRITGRDRLGYFRRKLTEALRDSDVRISLVAEQDAVPAGFIMARVDLGEFGRVESTAVIDTLGVDPRYGGRGIGRALLAQLLSNLGSLRVDRILTDVDWDQADLLGFLAGCGFVPASRLPFVRVLDNAPG
ncbi:MAG: GNAT family N-acetyltransferase [Gammaproteobacteria bacterium]|nr:GNAT family N-acetyltransferase [Gammaproteobacteria bacterium]